MQRKSLLCAVLLLFCFVSIFSSVTVFADAADISELHVITTKSDDGFVYVDMYVKNTVFRGIQGVFRFDNSVWQAVDAEGNPATDFEAFAQEKNEVFSTVGLSINEKKNCFGFTMFIMPNTRHELVNDKGEYSADQDGVHLYTFRFKQISDGDPNFEVAVLDDEKPYQTSMTDGVLSVNANGEMTTKVFMDTNEPEEFVYGTYVPKPEMTKDMRKQDTICMIVGKSVTVANGKKIKIDANNSAVVPYVDNDRTYVPLRFISEAFGAEVIWEEGMDGCIIKKDRTTIELFFDSCEFKVNGETVVNDVPIQLKHDRTMVPVRFVAEQLGCDVYWNELNEAVVISPKDNPWVEDRRAEIDALNEMMLTIVGIL